MGFIVKVRIDGLVPLPDPSALSVVLVVMGAGIAAVLIAVPWWSR
ncbi:hypothetical protein [Streptomyces cyaneofuscatus]